MKEIVISPKRIKTELVTLVICFVIANLINLYAILSYKNASFSELVTSLGYILILSVAIYLLWSLLRILFYSIKYLFRRKKKA